MHEIATNKFGMGERNPAFRVFRLPASSRERDMRIGNRKNTAVGNGNFMCVTPKIFDSVAKFVEGLLDVRTPVLLIECVFKDIPNRFRLQFFAGSGKGMDLCQYFGHKKLNIFLSA